MVPVSCFVSLVAFVCLLFTLHHIVTVCSLPSSQYSSCCHSLSGSLLSKRLCLLVGIQSTPFIVSAS